MADFVAVIRRAVDGLTNNTPEMRAKVYDKARSAVKRQLENMSPRPPEETLRRQLDKLDGQEIDYLPAAQAAQARVEPIYITLEGWKESTVGARKWADLPAQAIKYVRQVEELIGAPVALLSTSPERDDTILVTDPFED